MLLSPIKRLALFSKRCLTTGAKEQQCVIKDKKINFMKVGDGTHNVLCLPGLLGTMWTDFPKQIEHMDKSKFTLVCMDMPGCGGSRPPGRTFPTDFYHQDAECAANLMKELDVGEYSVLGWSDGGISGLILSSRYPTRVKSLVVWGANAYVSPNDINIFKGIRDIDNWSPKMVAPYLAAYGRDFLQKAMAEWCDVLQEIEQQGGDLCKGELKGITSPTLIIHGDRDPLVPLEHPLFLKDNIKNARLVRFPKGKHNLHTSLYKEFNDLVETFLLTPPTT